MVGTGISPVTVSIVTSAAKDAHQKHFHKYPSEGVDDLIQIGLLSAMQAHQQFSFDRDCTYSTWINRAIRADWMDRQRSLERRIKWNGEAKKYRTTDELNFVVREIDDSPVSLGEKLRMVYLLAKRHPPKTTKKRQGWVTRRSQVIAMAWLVKQSTMSNRAIADMLRNRKDLWGVIEMKRPPNYRYIHRCRKFVTVFGEKSLFE